MQVWIARAMVAASAVAAMVALTGCGLFPPKVPGEVAMKPAPEVVPPEQPVRTEIISGARGGTTKYAHKMVAVPDRYYHLRNEASIPEYQEKVNRAMMRMAYRELEKEALGQYGGWGSFYRQAFAKHYKDLADRAEPSPYATHYWWDKESRSYRSGGVTPDTDQAGFRSGWRSEYRGEAGGSGEGMGSAAGGGLPSAASSPSAGGGAGSGGGAGGGGKNAGARGMPGGSGPPSAPRAAPAAGGR